MGAVVQEDLDAFQEPLPMVRPPPWICQVPDMEVPKTEPEYVIDSEPTVPNWMETPLTVPWMLVGTLLNPEIMMVPLRSFPDCAQVNSKVPLNEPE
jgi:hypothetical protein